MKRNPSARSTGAAYSTAWSSVDALATHTGLGREIDAVDRDGRTGLHHAVIDGNIDVVRAALLAGADSSRSDLRGWTPLHFAAQRHDLAICALLVDAGALIDPRDEHGNTPLWRAVYESQGRKEVVELLLRSGANPDVPNEHGVSAAALASTIVDAHARPTSG